MDHGPNDIRNPGEARNRARQRRKWAFLIFAGLVGAVIGALLSGLENGEGNFLVGQIETLTMPAWAAIAMAAASSSATLWAEPAISVQIFAPPSSSFVTSSPRAAFTSGGPPVNIEP